MFYGVKYFVSIVQLCVQEYLLFAKVLKYVNKIIIPENMPASLHWCHSGVFLLTALEY